MNYRQASDLKSTDCPTPWSLTSEAYESDGGAGLDISDAHGVSVLLAHSFDYFDRGGPETPTARDHEIARKVIAAVNSHDALVDACRKALAAFGDEPLTAMELSRKESEQMEAILDLTAVLDLVEKGKADA